MEFTVSYRKQLYINFYNDINKILKKENGNIHHNGDKVQNYLTKLYPSKKIAQGAEGTVYLSHTQNVEHFIIKEIDLNAIFKKKGLSKNILNKNPLQIYELFYSMKKNINMPSLIETICYTLTNQLVFQNICPHFGLNYYWEYTTDNKIIYYNEYANYSTFFDWAKVSRSQQEWMNLLVQIIISIICMQKYFNIIHGDLHSLNILIYKVQGGGYWKYIIDDKEYIVPNLGWVILVIDFGFTSISGKVYIKWYYEDHIKELSKKQRIFYDFNYLSHDLIKQRQPVKNLLKETLKKTSYKSTKYTLINLLDDYYKEIIQPSAKPTQFIDTYDLNKQLNKMLLPENFRHLAKL
jgi:tRNA A-37 threonylcarbamoyl transferase component Bud32